MRSLYGHAPTCGRLERPALRSPAVCTYRPL